MGPTIACGSGCWYGVEGSWAGVCSWTCQKHSGDPNPQYFSKSTAVQMGGVLPYKWEAYCSTNGRRIAGFPFLRSLEARKVRRYKWGAYCRTNWRCTAVLSPRPVGVGVSETLPNLDSTGRGQSGEGWGGTRTGTCKGTHTGMRTQILHLPFSDLHFRKCPMMRVLDMQRQCHGGSSHV